MKVAIVGTGVTGLVTGAVLSVYGHEVLCVDRDRLRIDDLKHGVLPVFEPGLTELVQLGVSNGTLYFTADLASAIVDADVVFLCVEVPRIASGAADLSNLFDVAEEIAGRLKRDATVVIKSAVPIGTNTKVAKIVQDYCYYDIDIVSIPDFLNQGTAVEDCQNPDRIVLGVRKQQSADKLAKLYEPLLVAMGRPCPVLVMSPESAEMTKFTANSLLAMKASFINEISNLCEHLGADMELVRQGICTDSRIGWEFLRPHPEYLGGTYSKDVRSLSLQANDANCDSRLLKAIAEVNEMQKAVIPQKIHEHFNHELKGKRIAIWGLAFNADKEEFDDSPTVALIDALIREGAIVSVHATEGRHGIGQVFGDKIECHANKYVALQDANALVVMSCRPEYLAADPFVLQRHMRNQVVFDGQNCLNRERFLWNKFEFYSVGHANSIAEKQLIRT